MYAFRFHSSLAAIPCLALLVSGCVSGPDYAAPETKTPPEWHSTLEDGLKSEPVTVSRWWETLDDPTLITLIERAETNNVDLRVAALRVREARVARTVIAADRMPQVGVSGSYQLQRTPSVDVGAAQGGSPLSFNAGVGPNGLSRGFSYRGENVSVSRSVSSTGASTNVTLAPGGSTTPDRSNDVFFAGFDAAWELDLFGGVARALEAADAAVEAERERMRNLYVSLAAEVALNYMDLRLAQARLGITRRNIETQQETVRLTRARFNAGLISEFDAVRASAQLSATESQVPALETEVHRAMHRLSVLIGEAPGALQSLLDEPKPLPRTPDTVPVGLPSNLLQRRPDIRAAERELAAATARIGVAIAEQFPKFTLTGSLSSQVTGLSGNLLDSANQLWSIGPGISWPIFDGGRIRANIEVQDIRQEQALAVYEQTILLALEEVENGLVSFANEQVRRSALQESLDANRRAVRLANERYTKGLEDFLSVLTAQAQVLAAEEQLMQSESFVLMDLITLYKALGGGWEEMTHAP